MNNYAYAIKIAKGFTVKSRKMANGRLENIAISDSGVIMATNGKLAIWMDTHEKQEIENKVEGGILLNGKTMEQSDTDFRSYPNIDKLILSGKENTSIYTTITKLDKHTKIGFNRFVSTISKNSEDIAKKDTVKLETVGGELIIKAVEDNIGAQYTLGSTQQELKESIFINIKLLKVALLPFLDRNVSSFDIRLGTCLTPILLETTDMKAFVAPLRINKGGI